MRKHLAWSLVSLITLGVAAPLLMAQQEETGPPQFLTVPIRDRMRPVELENGHVVYVPPVARRNINDAGEAAPGGSGGRPGGGGGGTDFGQPGGVSVPANCFLNSANNFDATCASDSYQGEPMVAADNTPVNRPGGQLIGSENDIYPGACSASAAPGAVGDCGLSATVSTNGTAWQRFKLSRTWGGHTFVIGFDPSAAVDSAGRYFVAYGVADSGGSSANGIVVVSSSDGGATWTKTNPVALNLSGKFFEDKFWIAADANTGSPFRDRLYVAWDRNSGNNQILMVSSSSNQGSTWSAPKKINDGTSKFERVIYAFPAVAPDGTVYVLWHDYARQRIFIDKSTDGGANWGTDVQVATTNIGFAVELGCNGGRDMTPAPQMAIDAAGNIYVVFARDDAATGLNLDVFITKSTNGGATWSTPQRVSATSAGHQYNPAIAIDSTGAINVSYLDRRDDPANCRTHTYLSRSTDGGTSFTDSPVTDADSNFDGNPNGPGDYSGLACLGTTAHPYFSDHRDANVPSQTGNAGAFEIYSAIKP